MKKKILYSVMVALPLLVWIGCSDETGETEKVARGQEKEVKLELKSSIDNITKANGNDDIATRADQEATGDEKAFDKTLVKLFVYDSNGDLEYEENITNLPANNQHTITLTTGTKYFYVFANTGSRIIVAKQSRGEFERQILNVAIDTDGQTPDLAGKGTERKFFLGTLWAQSFDIEMDKDYVNDKPITLDIGRIVAKVKLWDVKLNPTDNPNYSVLKGELVAGKTNYRIGGVPKKTYLVGQHTGLIPPEAYTTVTSSVHNEGPGSEGSPNPIFTSYAWKEVTALPSSGNDIDNCFYVVENTTALDAQNLQYFNNTAHIRLQTTYKPHEDEIWNDELTANKQKLDDEGNFWTVVKDNQRYITNKSPITNRPGVDPNSVKAYAKGVQYHLFPIQDPSRTDVETRNTVLRNHYYEINVNGIRNLGDNEDDEGKIVPIPSEKDVMVTIKIKDWSKVTHSPKL